MNRTMVFSLVFFVIFGAALGAELSVGTTSLAPGSTGEINISFLAGGDEATGLQFDLQYDSSVLTLSVDAGAAATAAGKSLSTGSLQAGVIRVLIAGLNQTVIESGEVAVLTVSVAAGASPGDYPVTLADSSATDGSGQDIPLTVTAGAVTVPGAASATPKLVFIQGVNGAALGFANKTRLLLRNNGPDPDSGEILFKDGSGALLNSVPWSLGPWGSLQYETSGTGPLQVGPVVVTSSRGSASKLEGTEVFELLGFFVSVEGSAFRSSHQVYVSVAPGKENTGVAVFNPSEFTAITLVLILVDGQGEEAARTQLVLGAGQQTSLFVDAAGLFKTYLASVQGKFEGTLNIHVQNGAVAGVVGLLQRASNGALIAVAPSPNAFIQ